jgi:DNA-binding IclR family transcriptional regulator
MTVRVLRKAVAVLETLSAAGRPVGLAELARRMKYPKPTIYRILRSFQELGYLARDRETGCYVPTSRLAQLGRHGHMLDLRRRALPAMEAIHEEFDETVNLGVLEGDQISYAACLETTRPLRLMVRPGSSDPFYCTALGRAIAAFLPDREREELVSRVRFQTRTAKTVRTRAVLQRILRDTRRRGWAVEQEECDPGVVCIGAPLLEKGYPVAAISVTIPRIRYSPSRERDIVKQLLFAQLTP